MRRRLGAGMAMVSVVLGGLLVSRAGAVVATDAYECNVSPSAVGMVEWAGLTSTVADGIWTLDGGTNGSIRGGWYWTSAPYDGRREQPNSDFTVDVRFRIVSQTGSGYPFAIQHGVGENVSTYSNTEVFISQTGFKGQDTSPYSMALGSEWHILRLARNSRQGLNTWSYSLEAQIDNSPRIYPNGWGGVGMIPGDILSTTRQIRAG
jgi:hypothetical protein